MRTELRFGNVAKELARQLAETPEQMLILGISDINTIRESFHSLFNDAPARPILVVYQAPEDSATRE
jgi:hypothetical protein